jgi:hypothetical protein
MTTAANGGSSAGNGSGSSAGNGAAGGSSSGVTAGPSTTAVASSSTAEPDGDGAKGSAKPRKQGVFRIPRQYR